MKIGILADEFFDARVKGFGGFGWAAYRLLQLLESRYQGQGERVFISGFLHESFPGEELQVHGKRVILRGATTLQDLRKLRAEKFDLLVSIDYNGTYTRYLRALPRTPAIVWIRDPRTRADVGKILSCRIPGQEDVVPQGLVSTDGESMLGIEWESRVLGRKLMLATPAPQLVMKMSDCYGFEPDRVAFLPNPIELRTDEIEKGERPSVVFLGRLDPIKRPWLFVELARRIPHVEFVMLGQAHFQGSGAYAVEDAPQNLTVMGHQGEEVKRKVLGRAWAAINTSIHEGLAVSFLESFACGTPVISCQDPEFVVSRFGRFTGRYGGSGWEGLTAFQQAIEGMLSAPEIWFERGRQARNWVRTQHGVEQFWRHWDELLVEAGL
ncbi:MAG: glycosyltransferase family 4 protein [Acidobacteria bacterium]|nr:glycosyltransferase family 4 protein [Acidobacteriota bacterium]